MFGDLTDIVNTRTSVIQQLFSIFIIFIIYIYISTTPYTCKILMTMSLLNTYIT